ncbi:hypothetical protein C8F04DRAFT_1189068 [Mycena alexandri]|uniref:Uncharacterized protein n=1 Tax=Mycena alexandri TaxID=1745969 RepID=A0AAD6SGX4_9AGAR|nr:hypothetical protein C8F04DRAFT_1189068 [Mycena alexandri]
MSAHKSFVVVGDGTVGIPLINSPAAKNVSVILLSRPGSSAKTVPSGVMVIEVDTNDAAAVGADMGQPNDQTPSKPELRAGQNGTRDRGRMMKIGGLDDTTRQVMRERTALVFGDRQRDEGSGPDQRCDGSDGSGLRIGVIGATERRSVGVRSAGVTERGTQRTGDRSSATQQGDVV